MENLNKQQLEAVSHTDGPLLIVAGAGTGKTTVITRRMAYLIEQKLAKPDEILALTFTEKAAGEMQERLDLLMPLGYYDSWVSTFHSFCERILKSHALDIGISNDFKILSETEQWVFVYKNFEKFKLDYYRPLGSPNRFIDSLLSHFSRCKDEMITPQEYLNYAQNLKLSLDSPEGVKSQKPNSKLSITNVESGGIDPAEIARLEEIANAYQTYQKLLLDNNFLDFGDLIAYTLELFKKRPNVLKYYRDKFKFVMVDEFQDTNFAQYRLVKMLADTASGNTLEDSATSFYAQNTVRKANTSLIAENNTRNTAAKQNLVVVGDDDQSIYKFRGASVSNILKFREDFPEAKEITLVENYRSCQNILDLAYKFIQANNPNRLEIKLKIDKRLKANCEPHPSGPSKNADGIIEVLEGRDLNEELHLVVQKILSLKTVQPPLPVRKGVMPSPPSWNDFAILVRANSAADEIIPLLEAAGIPYTFFANRGLYKKPIIVDVLSYIKLLDNAWDSQSLYRVLTLPKFYLSHQELSALLEYAHKKTLSLYEALEPAQTLPHISEDGKKKIKKLHDLLHKHSQDSKHLTAAEMLVQIVLDIGLEAKLKEETLENAQSREHLDQFYKKIENFEKQNEHKDLHSFLQSLDLELLAGSEGEIKFDPDTGPESVKILTVHAAKGLEFKYVFIVNLVEQRFPTRSKSEGIEIPKELIKDILPEGDFHLQEERRLFYVALTRAKDGLFLSWAKDYGGKTLKRPSPFLVEAGLAEAQKSSQATGQVIFNKSSKNKAVYQRLPIKFSYSDLNTFDLCPLQYKYECYLKLPSKGSFRISFGITIHNTLEKFYKMYRDNLELPEDLFGHTPKEHPLPEFDVLARLYSESWIDDWYENKSEKEKYRKEGSKMLKVFYEDLQKDHPRPKYIEKSFRLKLGPYDFTGKIDRADFLNSGIRIIDYKTGNAPKNQKDLDQLYIYQWAAEEFLNEKVESLRYWFLKDNEILEEKLAGPEEISDLKAKMLGKIEVIVDAIKYDKFKELHAKAKSHNCAFENLE